MYDVVSCTIHDMAIIELVNHTFKNSQLAVAMKNAAPLPAAGFVDHKGSVCGALWALHTVYFSYPSDVYDRLGMFGMPHR